MPSRFAIVARVEASRARMQADRVTALAGGLAGGLAVVAAAVAGSGSWILAGALAVIATLAFGVAGLSLRRAIRLGAMEPIRSLAKAVKSVSADPTKRLEAPEMPEFAQLVQAIDVLRLKLATASPPPRAADIPMTASGMYEPTAITSLHGFDPTASGSFTTVDMVNRLHPKSLRWIESSAAEQSFLGHSLDELRTKSFLEIIHPDDRSLAWEQLQSALIKGEAHGLVYRIKTASGESKAIEVNVSVRFGSDMKVNHLRCHVTDVTAKVRASRELKRRTRELTLVNHQLRRTNRELQELKDRYSDLYQNAPAMYFSLDPSGYIIECNNTLLRTLGYNRHDLIGQPYPALLSDSRKAPFATNFEEFLRSGYIEVESRWKKANGDEIDVWVTGTAVHGPDGTLSHSRSVAQDVTPRRALKAELKEKNERLARSNVELSQKNKELDEFTYVVSHDLQEPLRTLIAFSDFLLKDCGDRLDANGAEYVSHIVEASRRMRALITDVLDLSRAGRVTGEFAQITLDDLISVVKADLAELIRAQGAEIRVVGPLPGVWGDRDRIIQLFGNLISNGIKYNQSGAPLVEIAAAPSDSDFWATLSVRDNGIGIDPEYHTKIFQIFRRLHIREEYEGTGAGLAICQKIVHAHGGRIWVESKLGEGATFFLTLPRLPAETPLLRTEVLNAP
jgi:PAS domain S-box-containing protein